jgi:hypothetical protein
MTEASNEVVEQMLEERNDTQSKWNGEKKLMKRYGAMHVFFSDNASETITANRRLIC